MPMRIANVGSSSRSRPNSDVLLTALADPKQSLAEPKSRIAATLTWSSPMRYAPLGRSLAGAADASRIEAARIHYATRQHGDDLAAHTSGSRHRVAADWRPNGARG